MPKTWHRPQPVDIHWWQSIERVTSVFDIEPPKGRPTHIRLSPEDRTLFGGIITERVREATRREPTEDRMVRWLEIEDERGQVVRTTYDEMLPPER